MLFMGKSVQLCLFCSLFIGMIFVSGCVDTVKENTLIHGTQASPHYYNNGISSKPLNIGVVLEPQRASTFLMIENPHINLISLVVGENRDTLYVGDKFPFLQRSQNFRQFVFQLPARPVRDTAWMRLDKKGENLSFGLRVMNAAEYERYTTIDNRIIGFVSGFYILAFLISLIIFLFNRTRKFTFFTLYVFFSLCWFFNDAGLFYAHLWPSAPSFHSSSRGIFSSLTMVFFGLYLFQNPSNKIVKGLKIAISCLIGVVGIKLVSAIAVATGIFPDELKQPTLYLNGAAISLIFGFIMVDLLFNLKRYTDDRYEILGIIIYSLFVFQLGMRELGFQLLEFGFLHHMEAILFFFIQIIFMSLHLYFSERKRREAEERVKVENYLTQQQVMADTLIEMEENEKRRIAQNIHDQIGSLFAAIKYRVLSLSQQSTSVEVQEQLEQLVMLSNHGIEKQYSVVDEMVFEVNRDKSLEQAIQEKAILLFSNTSITFDFDLQSNLDHLSEVQKIQLYRIVSELLTNTLKHANATHITIQLTSIHHIEMRYTDNGMGFDPHKEYRGRGLANIHNRVKFLKGELSVQSLQHGSCFIITIPL